LEEGEHSWNFKTKKISGGKPPLGADLRFIESRWKLKEDPEKKQNFRRGSKNAFSASSQFEKGKGAAIS